MSLLASAVCGVALGVGVLVFVLVRTQLVRGGLGRATAFYLIQNRFLFEGVLLVLTMYCRCTVPYCRRTVGVLGTVLYLYVLRTGQYSDSTYNKYALLSQNTYNTPTVHPQYTRSTPTAQARNTHTTTQKQRGYSHSIGQYSSSNRTVQEQYPQYI
eukprot:scaffold8015_cov149-Isochrysis_galbana.AAC.9